VFYPPGAGFFWPLKSWFSKVNNQSRWAGVNSKSMGIEDWKTKSVLGRKGNQDSVLEIGGDRNT
jgi:hypothetical protein